MGFFSDILGVAAPIVGGIFGGPVGSAIGGAVGGALSSSSNAKAAAQGTTTTQQIDPRMAQILYGANGNNGILNQFTSYLNQPQSAALQNYGTATGDYLSGNAAGDMNTIRNSAYGLLGGNQAPQIHQAQSSIATSDPTWTAPAAQAQAAQASFGSAAGAQSQAAPWVYAERAKATDAQASRVNAPGQNNLNLTSAFNDIINGNPAENPWLTGSLKAATDLTNASFNTNQNNVTNALQRNILPGLKSNAIASGGFGGSRQGIAEGLALSDYTNQLTNANTQLGAANSANTTAQMAGAFNQGEDRSLSALLNLSGQQYGVASQNSAQAQQASLANAAAANSMAQFNSGQVQNASTANANLRQNNNQFNASQLQANNQYNTSQANSGSLANAQLLQNNNQNNAQLHQNANQFGSTLNQNNNQFNAGQTNNGTQFNAQLAQQAFLANQGALMQTNQQNNAAALGGSGLLSGLQSTALAGATGAQNFGLNQAQAVNGLLAPYIGVNGTTNTTQPYYNNTAGNVLGGAAGALSLYNQFGGMGNSGSNYNAQDLRNVWGN